MAEDDPDVVNLSLVDDSQRDGAPDDQPLPESHDDAIRKAEPSLLIFATREAVAKLELRSRQWANHPLGFLFGVQVFNIYLASVLGFLAQFIPPHSSGQGNGGPGHCPACPWPSQVASSGCSLSHERVVWLPFLLEISAARLACRAHTHTLGRRVRHGRQA